ncbi:hypothetical protein [Micromonospora tulbaghiae]|uniref:hypothetical protein n=1 Tax=Micromonospora tulbaghiae TaxID=479978 RepID=UPI0036A06C1E
MTEIDSTLNRLCSLTGWVPGVEVPIDWPALAAAAAHEFPADYRSYSERFPPGALGALTVHHPHRWSGFTDYIQYANNYHSAMNERALMREGFPYRFGASDGELCMWGTVQADYLLCWQVSGQKAPEEWSTVVCDTSLIEEPERYDGSLISLLLDLAEGKEPLPVISYVNNGPWPFEFEAF